MEINFLTHCDSWGYTEDSIPSPASIETFERWSRNGKNASLKYLHFDDRRYVVRMDLKNYFPEFKSALVFLFSYAKFKSLLNDYYKKREKRTLKIASYALAFEGHDYHNILKKRLQLIANDLLLEHPTLKYKLSLDVHPVLEKDLAYRAGLGFFGKNSLLINRELGTYFLIGSLLLSEKLPLKIKKIQENPCGNCNKCIEACPTKAIDKKSRTIDCSKCISYNTTTPHGDILSKGKTDMFFGCEICQDACPLNKKLIRSNESGETINFSKYELLKKNFLKRICS